MKKSLLTLAMTAISSLGAFAQGYYYFKTTGIPDGYTSTPPSTATAIITGTATSQSNTLSAAQNMPFAFTYYGLNVSQFKVSTSGYLTFDVSQTADNTANIALPAAAAAPKLAIFAFWDNTRIQTLTQSGSTYASGVKSWVTGSAPTRVLNIQWQLVQTDDGSSATNVTYYALLLNENGSFQIVHNYGFGTFTATTGCQNLDGTIGTQVTGSPNMNFGGANGSNDPKASAVYNFRYGTQPATDMELLKDLTGGIASANGTGAQIKVSVANYGSNAITTSKMNYSVAGGATVSSSASTTNVAASGGTADFTHGTAYVPVVGDAGTSKTVKVWFTEINGTDHSDTLTMSLFINKGISGDKKVLIEEGSGAWCGYCPDGHYRLKGILEANPGKVVAAVHHNSDKMSFAASEVINTAYATGYPYGTVDRTKFDDQDAVGMSRSDWADKVTAQLTKPTPVNVSIVNKNFDWATGKVTYDVKVDFVDYAKPGDLRISTFIIENKVRGGDVEPTSSQLGWNQHNYYTYETGYQVGGASHPLYTEPFNIIGYWHNEVVRNIPSGSWGTTGIITDPSIGKSYTQSYTHTMTAANSVVYENSSTSVDTDYRSQKNGRGWNKYEDTKIIAFVSYYDADVTKRDVLNVTEATMINTGVKELAENTIGEVSVYPNPTNGLSTIDFSLTSSSTVKIEVVNVLGQKVADVAAGTFASGAHSLNFDASKLTSGIYFVNITSENGKATSRFVVSK